MEQKGNRKIKLIIFALLWSVFFGVTMLVAPNAYGQSVAGVQQQTAQDFINSGQHLSNPGTAGVPLTRPAPQSVSTTAGPTYYYNLGMGSRPEPESDNFVTKAFKWILIEIRTFFGLLLSVAATLFEFIVDPKTISDPTIGLLNSTAVQEIWTLVRDFLNMFFILVLLFSAFATIFQVDKYSFKKIWLTLVINALLVNFSFPIARFIIDISNVIMYYMLNNMFTGATSGGGSGILVQFVDLSHMQGVLNAKDYQNHGITYLVATNIFVFIFAMTLLVLAAMFLVRLVALTMLVMFSPIGFVGYIFPTTASYANKWWDNLFKYAFFGPIMVFIMMVAIKIMNTLSAYNTPTMQTKALMQGVSAAQSSWIADVAFYVIPISILWMGMGYAQSSGIAMSGTVLKKVKGGGDWLRKSMWNMTGGAAWKGTKMAANATGVPGGVKQAWQYNLKKGFRIGNRRMFGSDQTEDAAARVAGGLGRFGVTNAEANNILKRIGESQKEYNMSDLSPDAVREIMSRGTVPERLAGYKTLAEKGAIKEEELRAFLGMHAADSIVGKTVFDKVKEKSPHLAIQNLGHITDATKRTAEMDKIATKFDMKDMNESIAGNEDFMKLLIAKNKVGAKDLEKLNDPTRIAVEGKIRDMANTVTNVTGAPNTEGGRNRGVALKHFALSGEVPTALQNPALQSQRIEMWKKLNKDHAEEIKSTTISGAYGDEIAQNIDAKNVIEFVLALDKDLRGTFMNKLRATNRPELRAILLDKAIRNYS